MLIRALPHVRRAGARRPARARRRRAGRRTATRAGRRSRGRRRGGVRGRRGRRRRCPPTTRRGDVFALPCRTRGRRAGRRRAGHRAAGGGGARACRWWRAAPAARRRPCGRAQTGHVVDGRDRRARSSTRSSTCSPTRTAPPTMGAAGRAWMARPGTGTTAPTGWRRCSSAAHGSGVGGAHMAVPAWASGARIKAGCLSARVDARDVRPRTSPRRPFRLTFIVGVISPPASVKSTGRMRNSRICSARDTARFASATASPIAARRSGSSTRSASGVPAGLPERSSQPGSASSSIVTSAAMNGLPSPTTMHWLTSGCARSRSSSTAGATFLPPAVTISSFLRPVIVR